MEGLLAFTFCFYLNAGKTSTLYKVEAEKGRKVFVAFHTSNVSDIELLSSGDSLYFYVGPNKKERRADMHRRALDRLTNLRSYGQNFLPPFLTPHWFLLALSLRCCWSPSLEGKTRCRPVARFFGFGVCLIFGISSSEFHPIVSSLAIG